MEPATNTKIARDDFDSHKKTSFLLSDHHTPLSEHYPPLTEASLTEEQQLNESLIDIATPVFRRSAKFEPFRLSPTVLADCDADSSPVTSKASRRRDSGLVQMMSRLERLSIGGEFTPMAAESKHLRNRLNDLISTLSFSPSHNHHGNDDDDEASFLKLPSCFPDLE
jgi:hypothetical protein